LFESLEKNSHGIFISTKEYYKFLVDASKKYVIFYHQPGALENSHGMPPFLGVRYTCLDQPGILFFQTDSMSFFNY